MNLSGKVAIVTASTSGVGYAIAKQLVMEGCHVVVSSRQSENVQRTVGELEPLAKTAGGQVFGLQCDLLKYADLEGLIAKTIEKFGKLNILVGHTASKSTFGQQIMQASDAEWEEAFVENVQPVRQLARLALPHMKEQGGSMIFIANASVYFFPPNLGLYPVAKATLVASMKAIAAQVGEFKIRVNCIAPGVIETNFSQVVREQTQWADRILDNTALHRFGDPLEVARVAAFLASDYSSYVSGESIVVAGGAAVSHF